MDKLLKQFTYILGFTVVMIVAGCSENIPDEITTIESARLFSPTDFETRVVDKTSVRLIWKAVANAKSYNIEVFDNEEFTGSPVRPVTSVTFLEVPYTITGFEGETEYFVRIQAVGEGIAESNWVSATFKTDSEQIFQAMNPDEIEANQAIVHWQVGGELTEMIITPGDIKRNITAGEKTSGSAIITGLTGETTYTVVLKNGSKTRGTITFTTLIDLGGATAINPEDNLKTILEGASDGGLFALMPGTYPITDDITISKSISIKGARPANKPILEGVIFRVDGVDGADGAATGLELKDLVLDGTGAKGDNQTIIYGAGTFGHLKIENCEIKNYVKGVLYVNNASLIESVTVTGCVYSNITCSGGDFFDFRSGLAKTFTYTNNTAYNSAVDRDFFRMDAGGSTNFPGIKSIITITNNTFNNVSSGSASRRILYIRLVSHGITINKNIIANSSGIYSNQAATTITEMKNNNYFKAANYLTSTVKDESANGYTEFDPGFKDAENGDFTVSNETLKENGIGDPRWLK